MKQGFEMRFLRRFTELHMAVLVPSLVIAVFTPDKLTSILAIGVGVAWGLLLMPAAIACMIIALMRKPPGKPDGKT